MSAFRAPAQVRNIPMATVAGPSTPWTGLDVPPMWRRRESGSTGRRSRHGCQCMSSPYTLLE
ncbi:hypothetical protein EYF80_052621 [Liparis tanakae]|uniref:Uncharacterized protein n=1 Tax=Liparis tanakae TaxID=230148 RepID=A0A4Z2FA28_9TELE|nr:hypothetical protein EYF80_052621 [Liparis tanakae]